MTDLNQFSCEKRLSTSNFQSSDNQQFQGQFMPLSLSQQDICLDQLRQPDNPKYNAGGYMLIHCTDIFRLKAAHAKLVSNCKVFRLRFIQNKSEIQQFFAEYPDITEFSFLPVLDFSTEADPKVKANAWMERRFKQPLDVFGERLFESCLIKLDKDTYRYVAFGHHLMMDGWGFSNWVKALCTLYENPLAEMEELNGWSDVIDSDQAYQSSARASKDQAFWKQFGQGLKPETMWQVQHPIKETEVERHQFLLSNSETSLVRQLGQTTGVGEAAVWLALFSYYFSKHTDKSEFFISTPFHNRANHKQKAMLGTFTSVSPLGVKIDATESFTSLVERIAHQQKQVFRHQRLPLSRILKAMDQDASFATKSISVNFLPFEDSLTMSGQPVGLVRWHHHATEAPITLTVCDYGDQIQVNLEANAAYFQQSELKQISARLQLLMAQFCQNSTLQVSSACWLTDQDLSTNSELATLSQDMAAPVLDVFLSRVKTQGDKLAVTDGRYSLTFAELQVASDHLALKLKASGITSGDVVAISLMRSTLLPLAILACWKIGAIYVAVEPDFPLNRIQAILDDSQAKLLIGEESLSQSLNCEQFCSSPSIIQYLKRQQERVSSELAYTPSDNAYLIYTSGSTGKPKGVLVGHEAFAHLAQAMSKLPIAQSRQAFGWCASVNFDASLQGIARLMHGQTLVVISQEEKINFAGLIQTIHQFDIGCLDCTPGLAELWLKQGLADVPVQLLVGGEAISARLWQKLVTHQKHTDSQHFNLYGPSECTVNSTWSQITGEQPNIGVPLPHVQCYVFDKAKNPCPPGCEGELYIAGKGLASGYWRDHVRTEAVFLPFEQGLRYRTGDRVVLAADGKLRFITRNDQQVKIRGYRVELQDVQQHLNNVDCLTRSIVTSRQLPDGENQLIAYLEKSVQVNDGLSIDESATGTKQKVDETLFADIRCQLQANIPDYMVPTKFIVVEDWPLNTNGKIDLRALPDPSDTPAHRQDYYPQCEVEQVVQACWAELLHCDPANIGPSDSFFSLGGESLQALHMLHELEQKLGISLTLAQVFDCQHLKGLSGFILNKQRVAETEGTEYESAVIQGCAQEFIDKRTELHGRPPVSLPLSQAQQRMWFMQAFEGHSAHYNLPYAAEITGDFSPELAQQVLEFLTRRHAILRTVYVKNEDGEVEQQVAEQPFRLHTRDLSQLSSAEQQHRLQTVIESEAQASFELATELMIRGQWLPCAPSRGVLLLTLHHIACDAWSNTLILREFAALYNAMQQSPSSEVNLDVLPANAVTYADYACWQHMQAGSLDEDLLYWQQQLAEAPGLHPLPLDKPRPEHAAFKGKRLSTELNPVSYQKLTLLAREQGMTEFMLMHALFSLFIAKRSNTDDILIGTPVVNRPVAELQDVVGLFANTLVLRQNILWREGFIDYLQRIKQVNINAQEHQAAPFEQVIDKLNLERAGSHNPLFQIMLVVETDGQPTLALNGLNTNPLEPWQDAAKFDLLLEVKTTGDKSSVHWTYDEALFNEQTIQAYQQQFHHLCRQVAENPDKEIAAFGLFEQHEASALLAESHQPPRTNNHQQSIVDAFVQQVEQTHPHKLALVCHNKQLTYQTLDRLANSLATELLSAGLQRQQVVAVCLPPGSDFMVSLLAILKLGCIYLPLDPNYPRQRLEYLLENSQAKALIGSEQTSGLQQGFDGRFVVFEQLDLNEEKECPCPVHADAQELAYYIYTSGSTGTPKGTCIRHGNVQNLLHWYTEKYQLTADDKVLVFSSCSFDLTQKNLWAPLMVGASLHFAAGEYDVERIVACIEQRGITLTNCAPSALYPVVERAAAQDFQAIYSLRQVLLGGEPIEIARLQHWLRTTGCQLGNMYGPTECTDIACEYDIHPDVSYTASPPIGRANDNVSLYVLANDFVPQDGFAGLVAQGVVGELYIGGAGVTPGYLNQDTLTAEKFLPDPFVRHLNIKNSGRMYRTGDLVKWNAEGQLVFVGRADTQVKVRGMRIELGEIEAQLSRLKGISQAVVLTMEETQESAILVAYLAAASGKAGDISTTPAQLRQSLSDWLPEHMLPHRFVLLDAFPLTPNGKINRLKLPALYQPLQELYVTPSNALEAYLQGVWSALLNLKVEEVSCSADFFALGGHSLLVSQLIHRLGRDRGLSLSIKGLFAHSTVQQLAEYLSDTSAGANNIALIRQSEVREGELFPLSFSQYRIWFVEKLQSGSNQNNMAAGIRLKGIPDADRLQQALNQLSRRHDMLRCRIIEQDGQALQCVDPDVECRIVSLDARSLPEEIWWEKVESHHTRPFNLADGPLFRVLLTQLAEKEYRLDVSFHHIIMDGWSLVHFFNEWVSLYDMSDEDFISTTQRPDLAIRDTDIQSHSGCDSDMPFSYRDYVVWQQRFIKSETAQEQRHFWREYLQGARYHLDLDLAEGSEGKGEQNWVMHHLSQADTLALEGLAREHQASLFNLIHTGFSLLLGRLTGESDFNLGIPVTGRNLAGSEHIQGACLNNLPVRHQLNMQHSLRQMIQAQTANLKNVLCHQDLPFEEILAQTDAMRDADHTPLFQVFLNPLNLPESRLSCEDFSLEVDDVPHLDNKFDLTLYIAMRDQGVTFYASFDHQKFNTGQIERLLQQLIQVMQTMHARPDSVAADVSLILEQDKAILPDPTVSLTLPEHQTIPELFSLSAKRFPDSTALRSSSGEFSYLELVRLVDAHARQLLDQGIQRGDVVAVFSRREAALVVAVLATLQAGAAFMLLDPELPESRLQQQLKAVPVKACWLLPSDSANQAKLAQTPLVGARSDADPSTLLLNVTLTPPAEHSFGSEIFWPEYQQNQLAYVSFTSGTQGQAKAVMGRLSSLSAFMPTMNRTFNLDASDRFAMLSGLVHDPLHRDIFTPLCLGASLAVPDQEHYGQGTLAEWLAEEKVSVVHLTPSLGKLLQIKSPDFERVIQTGYGTGIKPSARLEDLRLGFFVGEALTHAHLASFNALAPSMQVVNLYGSTETSRAVSYFDCSTKPLDTTLVKSAKQGNSVIPVGQGLAGCQLLVVNDAMSLCAPGEVGQLAMRSPYLTKGYANDPELTKRVFIQNPFSACTQSSSTSQNRTAVSVDDNGDRIYLTGDTGRFDSTGVVHCLGRRDRQVKIRGFRVELADIESVLNQSGLSCKVLFVPDSDQPLVAFAKTPLQGDEAGAMLKSLQQHARANLPAYMQPNRFGWVKDWPLTRNGKLDMQTLVASFTGDQTPISSSSITPSTPTQIALYEIWQALFEREVLDIEQDFFTLGGHSLLATQALVRIREAFHQHIPYRTFFQQSSIVDLAEYLDSQSQLEKVVKSTSDKGVRKKTITL